MIFRGKLRQNRLSSLMGGSLLGTGTVLLINGIISSTVLAEENVEPPKYPWSHNGLADSYDHAR